MAVEIRELVIRALVVNDQVPQADAAPRQEAPGSMQAEKLVQECVNQVLKIIRKKENR